MKNIILSVLLLLGLVSHAGSKSLNVLLGEGRVAATSDSFQYKSGLIRFELGSKPDWIEHVIFSATCFERELGSTGGSSLSWSSSVAQTCCFKIVAKDNTSGTERSWQFKVLAENGAVLYDVMVVQQVGSKRSPKEDSGVCTHLKNGDIAMQFNQCGGVLKSNEVKNDKWPWCIDSSEMPEWVRFVKMKSSDGQNYSFGRSAPGGRNTYNVFFNASAECTFIVMTEANKTGSSRKWLLPVKDGRGNTLFVITIVQK